MAKLFRTREGDATAVDTRTQLTTVGSETAPGPLLVPQSMKFITGVIVSSIQNMAAATGFSGLVRLEGPGLPNGPETFAAVAGGNAVATGGNASNSTVRIPVNLPVTPANEILIFGEMCGTDVGGVGFVVTLEFSTQMEAGGSVNKTFTVEGDIGTVDSKTLLTTQGSVTAPSPVVPSTVKKIDKIVFAVSSEGLADGKQVWFLRLGGNAVQNGEQVIAVGSSGRIAVQSGSDAAAQHMISQVLNDVDIAVSPSDTLTVAIEGAGDDTGTGHAVVTLIYA
ncbi:MAG: hypothetical protein NUV61_02885 [Candidatus Azambacteria bacterium]|nr:hypothetical protein [Candidatus Azambacteria bacterium]